ncbi:MAG: hypothetical protein ACD_75C00053G0001 [uncultured bacterium]|nr:MAG: hypothetical protein ACD_75C00053G0001 [uncultured bacterium]
MKYFLQTYDNLVGHVLAFFRRRTTSTAASAGVALIEKRRKGIPPHVGAKLRRLPRAAKPELTQDIVEVEAPENIFLGIALMEIRRTIEVILLFFLRIGQYGIGFADLFKLGLGILAAVVFIGVMFKREFSVRFLNVRRG